MKIYVLQKQIREKITETVGQGQGHFRPLLAVAELVHAHAISHSPFIEKFVAGWGYKAYVGTRRPKPCSRDSRQLRRITASQRQADMRADR